MLLSSFLLSAIFSVISAKKYTPITEPAQFCDNYATCLSNLEAKQRECLAFPSEIMDLRGSSTMHAAVDANTNATRKCTKRKQKDLQRELAELHLKRTEVLRTCVKENARRARSILNSQKERKCLANSEKLVTFVELAKNGKADGKKGKRGGKTEVVKERGNKRKSESKKTTDEPTTISTTASSPLTLAAKNGAATGSSTMKKRAKRRVTLAANKKHSAKTCKRAKKFVARKCQQISKCCSIVNECQLIADAIDIQITELKMEFKASSCVN